MTTSLTMENTIKPIIVLAVLALMFLFLFPQVSKIYASFKGYDDLKESQKQLILNNFDKFVETAQNCRKINDKQCLCKNAFLNFPDTFSKEITIDISQGSTNVSLVPKYDKNPIPGKNATLEMTGFSFVRHIIDILHPNENPAREENRAGINYMIMNFKYNPRLLKGAKESSSSPYISIISGDLYKGEFPSTLDFIVSGGSTPMPEQVEFFSKFPQCMSNREEAIQKFDAFVANLETKTQLTVELPDDYSIFYGAGVIKLKYKNEDVERYDEKEKTSSIVRILKTFDIKCKEPAKSELLLNGDIVNISKTAQGFCINKV